MFIILWGQVFFNIRLCFAAYFIIYLAITFICLISPSPSPSHNPVIFLPPTLFFFFFSSSYFPSHNPFLSSPFSLPLLFTLPSSFSFPYHYISLFFYICFPFLSRLMSVPIILSLPFLSPHPLSSFHPLFHFILMTLSLLFLSCLSLLSLSITHSLSFLLYHSLLSFPITLLCPFHWPYLYHPGFLFFGHPLLRPPYISPFLPTWMSFSFPLPQPYPFPSDDPLLFLFYLPFITLCIIYPLLVSFLITLFTFSFGFFF